VSAGELGLVTQGADSGNAENLSTLIVNGNQLLCQFTVNISFVNIYALINTFCSARIFSLFF